MNTSKKTGIDAAKTASKRVVVKTAKATGDLMGNKVADNINSVSKSKKDIIEPQQENGKMEKINKSEGAFIPLKKCQQIIDDLR